MYTAADLVSGKLYPNQAMENIQPFTREKQIDFLECHSDIRNVVKTEGLWGGRLKICDEI